MRENLDLKLTPYNVLATSISQGLVEFIDSMAVAQILREDTSIQVTDFYPTKRSLDWLAAAACFFIRP